MRARLPPQLLIGRHSCVVCQEETRDEYIKDIYKDLRKLVVDISLAHL